MSLPINPVDAAKATVDVVGAVIKAAGDHPDVKVATGELAKTAVTLTKAVNVLLLPLAAVNFAYDKARDYFNTKFADDLAEASSHVPPENLTEPKPSIAGPALQGLAFALDEAELKRMYLKLLASAMDSRAASAVHPAFVELIRQLTAEEARLLRDLLNDAGGVPIVEIRLKRPTGVSYDVLETHVLNFHTNDAASAPVENPRHATMVDNWVRLGLARVSYMHAFATESRYAWVEARPELARHRAKYAQLPHLVTYEKGTLIRTDLGVQFGQAVGLFDKPAAKLVSAPPAPKAQTGE